MVHFDVVARDADRELLRALAQRLANDDAEAARIRLEVRRTVALPPPAAIELPPPSPPVAPPKSQFILAALRRSPLVGANLDLSRAYAVGRGVEV
ncbi:MAG TPA: hypothetical protein VJ890_16285 [Vineibacter sp.]|nr:hypothetical protein [Vineibacter sp.]